MKDKLIENLKELVETLTIELISPEPTTFESEAEYSKLNLKEIRLREEIALIESELVKEEPEGVTADVETVLFDVMTDNNFTYVSFPAFVENESSVDVFDIACKAMERIASSKQIDLRKEFDTSKVYISPPKEMITIFLDGKWQIFVRNDVVQEILKNIHDYTDSKWNVMKQ